MKTNSQSVAITCCATCPCFEKDMGVHGWCRAFDRMAKPHHQPSPSCTDQIVLSKPTSKPAITAPIAADPLPPGYYFDNDILRWEPTHETDLEPDRGPDETSQVKTSDWNCEEF